MFAIWSEEKVDTNRTLARNIFTLEKGDLPKRSRLKTVADKRIRNQKERNERKNGEKIKNTI